MIVEAECAKYAITLAYNVQGHPIMSVRLVQTLFLLKDHFIHNNVSVQTNILMILKINFASLAHQHAILAKVIKIHALNV